MNKMICVCFLLICLSCSDDESPLEVVENSQKSINKVDSLNAILEFPGDTVIQFTKIDTLGLIGSGAWIEIHAADKSYNYIISDDRWLEPSSKPLEILFDSKMNVIDEQNGSMNFNTMIGQDYRVLLFKPAQVKNGIEYIDFDPLIYSISKNEHTISRNVGKLWFKSRDIGKEGNTNYWNNADESTEVRKYVGHRLYIYYRTESKVYQDSFWVQYDFFDGKYGGFQEYFKSNEKFTEYKESIQTSEPILRFNSYEGVFPPVSWELDTALVNYEGRWKVKQSWETAENLGEMSNIEFELKDSVLIFSSNLEPNTDFQGLVLDSMIVDTLIVNSTKELFQIISPRYSYLNLENQEIIVLKYNDDHYQGIGYTKVK